MGDHKPHFEGDYAHVDLNSNETKVTGGRWILEEDERLKQVVKEHGPKNWKVISKIAFNGSRTDVQCLHRWQKVLRPGLVKGPWTKEEDDVIVNLINTYGIGNIKWSEIAAALPGRLGKQCRERWVNHLDPNLKKSPWSEQEDRILMQQQQLLGNKWRDIAAFLPGRSENSVKNRWNSARRKRKRSEAAAAAAMSKNNANLDPNSLLAGNAAMMHVKDVGKKIPGKRQKPTQNNDFSVIHPYGQAQANSRQDKQQQQQMINAMMNPANLVRGNAGMPHYGGYPAGGQMNYGGMIPGMGSEHAQSNSNDFGNQQHFGQPMMLGMGGMAQGNTGSLSPTFLGPGSIMPMNNAFGMQFNDPMSMMFQTPNQHMAVNNNFAGNNPGPQTQGNNPAQYSSAQTQIPASQQQQFTGQTTATTKIPELGDTTKISPTNVSSKELQNSHSSVVKNNKGSGGYVEFPGLRIVGSGLTQKQKELLKEEQANNNGNNPTNPNNAVPNTKIPKMQDAGFEVLGMKLENLNSEQDQDAFELFTFDDLVGDMTDFYASHKNTGLHSNSCSPIATNYGSASPPPMTSIDAPQNAATSASPATVNNSSHQPGGQLYPRALSPATVNALLGNIAPTS